MNQWINAIKEKIDQINNVIEIGILISILTVISFMYIYL